MFYILVTVLTFYLSLALYEINFLPMEASISLIMGLIILWQIRHRK